MILIPKEKYERLVEMNEKIKETNMSGEGEQSENKSEENNDSRTEVKPNPVVNTSEVGISTDQTHVILTPNQFQDSIRRFKSKRRTGTPSTNTKKWLKL